jgi:SAM-dependent methyltransferase
MAIQYSDGVAIEERILGLLKEAPELGSDVAVAAEHYDEWPVRYHLCRERANLLRHLDLEGLDVLEVGAGMGAVSRSIAERARSLTVVEGSPKRFECLSERLRDLDNWSGQVANIQDVTPEPRFDVVCLLGVLEYAELYLTPESDEPGAHYRYMLELCRAFLKPDGVLLVAIENQLGLKYWSGAVEDHTSRIFDGITGYSRSPSARTFSRSELRELLDRSGLAQIDEFYPFPDYKLPSAILTPELLEAHADVAAELATSRPFESYGLDRTLLFPEALAATTIARAGLLHELANSFLFMASRDGAGATRARLLRNVTSEEQQGWYYALERRIPVRTSFGADGQVRRRVLYASDEAAPRDFAFADRVVHWSPVVDEILTGQTLRHRLVSRAWQGEWSLLVDEFHDFVTFSRERWAVGGDAKVMDGGAIDAILSNAIPTRDGFALFDLEWRLEGSLPVSWFVLRNVLALVPDEAIFHREAPFGRFSELYEQLCQRSEVSPQLRADLEMELDFKAAATTHDREKIRRAHEAVLDRKFEDGGVALDPRPGGGGRRSQRLVSRVLGALVR